MAHISTVKPIRSHYCGLVFWRKMFNSVFFLTVDYMVPIDGPETRRGPTGKKFYGRLCFDEESRQWWTFQTKFAGGMGAPGENAEQTRDREASEELFVELVTLPYAQDAVQVYTHDDGSPAHLHEKNFYIIDGDLCPDSLRNDTKSEDDGVILGIPRMLHVSDLAGRSGQLFSSHQVALAAAIQFLVNDEELELRKSFDPRLLDWAARKMDEQEARESRL